MNVSFSVARRQATSRRQGTTASNRCKEGSTCRFRLLSSEGYALRRASPDYFRVITRLLKKHSVIIPDLD